MAEFQFHHKRPHDGQTWGNWRLDVSNLTLNHKTDGYYIDLESIDGSAEMLDWIMQINAKSWATTEDKGNLVEALNAIFYPQANLCSGGADRKLDAKAYLDQLFGALTR